MYLQGLEILIGMHQLIKIGLGQITNDHMKIQFAIPGRAREDRAFAGHRRGSGDRAFAGYDSYDGARSDQAHYKPRNMRHDVENEETKDSIKSLSITLPTLAPHTGREEWAGGWRVVIG